MLDTKIIIALENSSTQRCYICNCTISKMNNIEDVCKLPIREEGLKYGLSVLHAWIKFLECILHLAYKIEFRKWSTHRASVSDRENIATRKKEVQSAIWKDIGVRVDQVVQGLGSSNTGNVSRRFFGNPEAAASCTGVDLELIKRFRTILLVKIITYTLKWKK